MKKGWLAIVGVAVLSAVGVKVAQDKGIIPKIALPWFPPEETMTRTVHVPAQAKDVTIEIPMSLVNLRTADHIYIHEAWKLNGLYNIRWDAMFPDGNTRYFYTNNVDLAVLQSSDVALRRLYEHGQLTETQYNNGLQQFQLVLNTVGQFS